MGAVFCGLVHPMTPGAVSVGRIVVGYGEELGRWGSADAHAEVRWWVVNPGGVPLSAWFADSETDRIMRLRRMEDRRSHFLAHCLAKNMLADHVEGIDGPGSVISHEASGRPVVACGTELSISHSVSSVAVAVTHSEVVGVDVEDLSRANDVAAVRDIMCSQSELRIVHEEGCDEIDLLRLWVAKEALVKIGAVTLDGFRRADLSALLLNGPVSTQVNRRWWSATCGEVDLTVWRDSRCVGAVARAAWRGCSQVSTTERV